MMPVARSACLCFCLLISISGPRSASWAWSQATVQTPQSGSLPSPESIREILLDETQIDKRQDLAARLDIRESGGRPVVLSFDDVKIDRPALERDTSYAVLTLRSSRWTDFVIVLEHRAAGWKLSKTFSLFSKYEHPKITFPELIEKGIHEIEIDADTLFAGTGWFQCNLVIHKLYDGVPVVIFDQPKTVRMTQPPPVGAPFEGGNQQRETTFTIVPGDPNGSSLCQIIGSEVLRQAEKTVAIYAAYVWYPSIRMFRSEAITQGTFKKIAAGGTRAK
jgi:hypothetical protein